MAQTNVHQQKHRTELVAIALCRFEGREPHHQTNPGEPQWMRFESQARVVLSALNGELK